MADRSREASVGLVIFLGGLVLVVGILAVGKESRFFARKVEYWTTFPNVSGLAEGSPVKLVGVQVGTVSKVEFSSNLGERDIRVTFQVDRQIAARIREGTQAQIKSLSYVSQERYIELTPGDSDRPPIPPGSRIEPGLSGLAELTEMGRGIADDVKDITSQLRELLIALNQGGGVLSEMIRNPEFGRPELSGLQKTLESVQRIADRIEKGQGLAAGLLLNEEYGRRQMASLQESLDGVKRVVDKLDAKGGAFGELTTTGGKGDQLLNHLVATGENLHEVTGRLKSGKGLAGRLLQDDESARALLQNLEKTTRHLESITSKMDRGEGTVGALINDPEVYQGLRDVVAGIKKSRVGKGVIHHYQKKGIEEREEGSPQTEPAPDNP